MGFYTLTIIKFSLGMLVMILQINILGKREFSLNTPLNQVQNYVLGGIIGGVIYNPSVTVLQFLIVLLIWSLVIVAAKLLFREQWDAQTGHRLPTRAPRLRREGGHRPMCEGRPHRGTAQWEPA